MVRNVRRRCPRRSTPAVTPIFHTPGEIAAIVPAPRGDRFFDGDADDADDADDTDDMAR
jgi:hypothetical protein